MELIDKEKAILKMKINVAEAAALKATDPVYIGFLQAFETLFVSELNEQPLIDAVEVVWKPIKGYEKFYEVNALGQVRGLERNICVDDNGRKYSKSISNRIMTQGAHSQGYKIVSLTKNGQTKSMYVHRLVADAFIPNPENLPFVNHKDEDKPNCYVENL